MKFNRYIILVLCAMFGSCQENFSLEENTNTQFNVRVDGAELPVFVRGNTASKKIILFVNGGPGLASLDQAHLDLMKFKTIESSHAMAYYDQRGTGNAQGVSENSLTLKAYSKDLFEIIRVLEVKFNAPDIYIMSHGFGSFISSTFLLDYAFRNNVKGWINLDGAFVTQDSLEWDYRRAFLENIAQEEIDLGRNVDYWSDALAWTTNNPIISAQTQKDQWRNYLGKPGEFIIPAEQGDIKTRQAFNILFNSSYNPFAAIWSNNGKITAERISKNAHGTNLIPELSELTLPTLFIYGRYDDMVTPELGEDAFDELNTPNTDKFFKLYLNSGHQPFVNESNLLTLDVVDFVGKY